MCGSVWQVTANVVANYVASCKLCCLVGLVSLMGNSAIQLASPHIVALASQIRIEEVDRQR